MECELKVLNIKVKEIESKLEQLGAKKLWAKEYKRILFDFENKSLDKKDAWLRLRTDGKKTTLTYKQTMNREIDGTKEIEIEVNNFKETMELLKQTGLTQAKYQESKRTRYAYKDITFDIDEWPLIPPYLEIEAKTKQKVLEGLKILKLKNPETTTLHGRGIYKKYGLNIDSYKKLGFKKQEKIKT